FKIPVHRGDVADASALFDQIAHWTRHSRYFLSDAIGFTWPKKKSEVWAAAIKMVSQLTLIYERAFRSASESIQLQTFGETSESFMSAFLTGAEATDDVLHDVASGRSEPLLYDLQ